MTLRPGGMDVVVGAGHFALAMEDALATTASRSERTPCKHSFLQSSTSAQAETSGRERTQLIFAHSRSLRRPSRYFSYRLSSFFPSSFFGFVHRVPLSVHVVCCAFRSFFYSLLIADDIRAREHNLLSFLT